MSSFLTSAIKQFEYYKLLGDKTFKQLSEKDILYKPSDSDNSIAVIANHLIGNMLSRWTDFLTADGEKEWRNRDQEFEDVIKTKQELLDGWEKGWSCVFNAIKPLKDTQVEDLIVIRNQQHTITEAINRQLCHYAYHIGQLVFLAKVIKKEDWTSLSIPKGKSKDYNKEKFSQESKRAHFTDEFIDTNNDNNNSRNE